MSKNFIQALALDSIDSATFTGALQAINPAGNTEACVILRIINDSDVDIEVSYDGITDHDYIRAGETLILDFQTNAQPNSKISKLKKGTVVWVASTTGAGTGLVYLAGYYQPE